MEKIFDLNNPVWKFIGNLWDFFVLSVLTVLCSLPVVTAGAALTALYYVTLKMASDEEGKVVPQFWQAFRGNLRQVTPAWILLLLIGAVLGIDFLYGLTGGTNFASAMLIVSGICLVLYGCVLLMSPLCQSPEYDEKYPDDGRSNGRTQFPSGLLRIPCYVGLCPGGPFCFLAGPSCDAGTAGLSFFPPV